MPAELTLRFRLFDAPDAAVWQPAFDDWRRHLEGQSNGRLKLAPAREETPLRPPGDTYPQAAADDGHPLLKALRTGSVDVIWIRPSDLPNVFPRLEVFELPYMVREPVGASRALWEYVQVHMPEAFGDLRLIALHVNGPEVLHVNAAPRPQADPLCARPLIVDSRWVRALFDSLDCPDAPEAGSGDPARSFALPYASLEAVSGGTPGWEAGRAPRLHIESMPEHAVMGMRTYLVAMSAAAFERLPGDLRRLFDITAGAETSAWLAARMRVIDDQIRARVTADSMVRHATLDEHERLRVAANEVREQWLAHIRALGHDGQPLLDSARTLIRQHNR